mmetsp:Transcript_46417/g.109018  ORF Transcript_46417/g.109018 Transcript_46417/m.109018 type:complete len:264 (+) Transcript_46417:537-1328(+)
MIAVEISSSSSSMSSSPSASVTDADVVLEVLGSFASCDGELTFTAAPDARRKMAALVWTSTEPGRERSRRISPLICSTAAPNTDDDMVWLSALSPPPIPEFASCTLNVLALDASNASSTENSAQNRSIFLSFFTAPSSSCRANTRRFSVTNDVWNQKLQIFSSRSFCPQPFRFSVSVTCTSPMTTRPPASICTSWYCSGPSRMSVNDRRRRVGSTPGDCSAKEDCPLLIFACTWTVMPGALWTWTWTSCSATNGRFIPTFCSK